MAIRQRRWLFLFIIDFCGFIWLALPIEPGWLQLLHSLLLLKHVQHLSLVRVLLSEIEVGIGFLLLLVLLELLLEVLLLLLREEGFVLLRSFFGVCILGLRFLL